MAFGKKIFIRWMLGAVAMILAAFFFFLAFPGLAYAAGDNGQLSGSSLNWTWIISSAAVATIFAGAWLGGKSYKMRAELERCLTENKIEIDKKISDTKTTLIGNYNENKGRIQLLENNFGNIRDDLTEIKLQQRELGHKLDDAIKFIPKRENNHFPR